MAINIQYAPSPLLVGPAANLAGQGELARYEQQMAQRDQQMALQEQQFAEQQRQNDIRTQLAQQQMGMQAYQFDVGQRSQFYNAERARQAQLAAQAMQMRGSLLGQGLRGQQQQQQLMAQLMGQQMAGDQRMQLAQMEQEALGGRQQNQIQAQLDMQSRAAKLRQAADDWSMLQKARQHLDEDQYNEAVGQWQENYADIGMGMPLDLPPEPEGVSDFDPEKVAAEYKAKYPNFGVHVTPDGKVGIIDRAVLEYSPEAIAEREKEREMKLQELQTTQQFEAAQQAAEMRAKFAEAMAKARETAEKTFIKEIQVPAAQIGGKPTVRQEVDREKADEYIRAQRIINRSAYMPPPVGQIVDGEVVKPIPPGLDRYVWVMSEDEIELLDEGTMVTFWNGKDWVFGRVTKDKAEPAAPPAAPARAPAPPAPEPIGASLTNDYVPWMW